MEALTAVNVLLKPDEAARERAKALNAALRADLASGFAFDDSHEPHITLLQRHVRSGELDDVTAAVGDVAATLDLGALELRAVGLSSGELGTPPGTRLVSLEIEPVAVLRALHAALLRALGPSSQTGGTEDAFFRLPGEPVVNAATVAYVGEFVPEHSDARYSPHMTVGIGRVGFIDSLAARPFGGFTFAAEAIALYRLGDLGTARQEIRSWPHVTHRQARGGR